MVCVEDPVAAFVVVVFSYALLGSNAWVFLKIRWTSKTPASLRAKRAEKILGSLRGT
jgi:hypothetical protein